MGQNIGMEKKKNRKAKLFKKNYNDSKKALRPKHISIHRDSLKKLPDLKT